MIKYYIDFGSDASRIMNKFSMDSNQAKLAKLVHVKFFKLLSKSMEYIGVL